MNDRQIVQIFAESIVAVLWLYAAYLKLSGSKRVSGLYAIPGKFFKLCLALVALGLLAGCGTEDPLATASGPLFVLNAGHWQPTSQELASPPPVTDQ
jgi:hypothetical protein